MASSTVAPSALELLLGLGVGDAERQLDAHSWPPTSLTPVLVVATPERRLSTIVAVRPPDGSAAPCRQATGAAASAGAGSTSAACSFSMRTAHTLNSAVLVTGSKAALVSSLTGDSL